MSDGGTNSTPPLPPLVAPLSTGSKREGTPNAAGELVGVFETTGTAPGMKRETRGSSASRVVSARERMSESSMANAERVRAVLEYVCAWISYTASSCVRGGVSGESLEERERRTYPRGLHELHVDPPGRQARVEQRARLVHELHRQRPPLAAPLELGALEVRREAERGEDEARLDRAARGGVEHLREEARDVDEAEPVQRHVEQEAHVRGDSLLCCVAQYDSERDVAGARRGGADGVRGDVDGEERVPPCLACELHSWRVDDAAGRIQCGVFVVRFVELREHHCVGGCIRKVWGAREHGRDAIRRGDRPGVIPQRCLSELGSRGWQTLDEDRGKVGVGLILQTWAGCRGGRRSPGFVRLGLLFSRGRGFCLLALLFLLDAGSGCACLLDFVRGELPRAWRAVFAAASGGGVVGALAGGGVCSAHTIEAFGFGAVTLDFAIATVG